MKPTLFILFIFFSVSYAFSQTLKDEYKDCAVQKFNSKEYQESIDYFTKIIEINPKDSTAYNDRGLTKELLKDFKGAI